MKNANLAHKRETRQLPTLNNAYYDQTNSYQNSRSETHSLWKLKLATKKIRI